MRVTLVAYYQAGHNKIVIRGCALVRAAGDERVLAPNIVKVARTKLGMGQDGMAALLGVSKNTIYNWEKGKTTPSPAVIDRIHQITMEREDARQVELAGGHDLCLVVAPNGFFRAPYGPEARFAPFRETYQAMTAALNRAYWLHRTGRLGHAFIVGASERVLVDFQELRLAIEADNPTTFWLSAVDESPIPFDGRMVWRQCVPEWSLALDDAAALIAQGLTLKMGTPNSVLNHDEIVDALQRR